MMRKVWISVLVLLSVVLVYISHNGTVVETIKAQVNRHPKKANYSNEKVVNGFIIALQTKNSKAFNKLVSPSGLVVIRHYLWGTPGARGKNVRDWYAKNKIPTNLMFQVDGEISIDPAKLFENTLKNGIKENSIVNQSLKDVRISFKDNGFNMEPSMKFIVETCQKVILTNNNREPKVFKLNNMIVLTESTCDDMDDDGINDLLNGHWAIFEKTNGEYWLRGIMTFL